MLRSSLVTEGHLFGIFFDVVAGEPCFPDFEHEIRGGLFDPVLFNRGFLIWAKHQISDAIGPILDGVEICLPGLVVGAPRHH